MGLKSLLGGLLSGGKAKDIFFPKNSLIQDYGIGNGQVFSVKISAFKQADVTVKEEKGGLKVDDKPNPSPIGEFEIMYAPESIPLNHQHTYGDSSFVHQTVKKITEKKLPIIGLNIQNALSIANAVKQISQGGSTPIKTPWNTFGGLDLAKAYSGSTAPEFTLDFNLVTHTDPLKDVVFPATLLAYYSYPKVSGNNKGVESILSSLGNTGGAALGAISSVLGGGDSGKKATQAAKDQKKSLDDVAKGAKALTKGKWRYLVGDAPPYWTLSCSNGIYSMFNASLKSVNITYHGPWLESPSAGLDIGQVQSLVTAGGGFDPSKIFGGAGGGLSADAFTSSLGGNTFKGYPSWASVSLVFENNYSKVFGEEIIAGLTGGSGISVGVK